MKSFAAKVKGSLPLGLSLILLAFGLVSFLYTDISDTLDNSVLLAESLARGEVGSFYRYAAENAAPSTVYPANYDLPIYILFALWNLPVIIAHMAAGFDYAASAGALLWCKLMLPFFFALSLAVVSRLAARMPEGNDETGKTACFLMLSSLASFVPVMIASQYDIIELFFILLGMEAYADKKTARFVLFFAIAVPIKIFAVFVFIPLVLLRYKNVFKILALLALCMLPSFAFSLPFAGDPYYAAALSSQNADAVRLLMDSYLYINGNATPIHPFLIVYILLCIAAYFIKEPSSDAELSFGVYFSFAAYASFCMFTPIRSYWMILFVPFLSILSAARRENGAFSLVLDVVLSASLAVYQLADHWIYNTGCLFSRLALRSVSLPPNTVARYGHFEGFLRKIGLFQYRHLLFAVFCAACLFALWYFLPKRRVNTRLSLRGEYWARLARPLLLLLVCALMLFTHFAPGKTMVLDAGAITTGENGILASPPFRRTVIFEYECTLSAAAFPIEAPNVNRKSRSMIRLCIYSGDALVYEAECGAAGLGEDHVVTFPLPDIAFEPGIPYVFELSGRKSDRYDFGDVYPAFTPDGLLALTLY